ncbi:TolB-like translocation protein [Pontibacter ramchanderi]|uniref:Uncharacterized protein n=1 Tax=Pontibacter ramchanderi TaxID=1179743 RepID=A0A2N3V291_9BACT|nr:hypothetical protein [Pontibacter ramchanderi]PKV75737.1 hypothetical protein BD749_0683 [Pontibacter ramchanderi]
MQQFLRFIYGVLPLFLFSCDFSPSGSHYRELDPTPRADYKLNLNEQGDTLYARGSVTYEFNVQTGGKKVYGVELWLGERRVYQNLNRTGTVKINTAEFADGHHNLKMMVRASTGTGSLSDHLGSEQLEVYRQWVMVIENAGPTPTRLLSIKAMEGTLELNWEPYARRYIKNYIVYRYNERGQLSQKLTLSPNITTWQDVHYVGGDMYYSIGVEDLDGRIAESERVFFTSPIPRLLSYEYIGESDMKVTFSSSRFQRNFGYYRFLMTYGYNNGYADHEITNVNDTVLTIKNVPFGIRPQYSLTSYPEKFTTSSIHTSDYNTLPGMGEENAFTPFVRSHYAVEADLFYDFSQSELKVIDGQSLALLRSKNYTSTTVAMSADSRLLYLYTSSGLLRLDPLTLEVAGTWQLADLVPLVAYNSMSLHVSNTNRLLIYLRNTNGIDRFYVVNMDTGALELNEAQNYSVKTATISPDGQMVAAPNLIYLKQSNGTWLKESKTGFHPDAVLYHPKEPLYIERRAAAPTFFSTRTNTPVRSIQLQGEQVISTIDKATGYLVVYDYQYVYIYNSEGNQVLKKINAIGSASFVKNRLYAKDYYLPLTF